jgi:hypothetical protein
MFQQKVRSFNKIYLSISLYKIVANRLNVVNDHHFNALVFNSLGQVYKDFVIIFKSLTVRKNNVLADLLLRNFVLILHKEKLFNFIESFFI